MGLRGLGWGGKSVFDVPRVGGARDQLRGLTELGLLNLFNFLDVRCGFKLIDLLGPSWANWISMF